MITLLGPTLTEIGHCHRKEIGDNGKLETRAWACSALNVRHQQPAMIPLNIDHTEHRVGQVIGLHRRRGRLFAIAEADADELLDFDEPIFYSAETTMRPDGTDVLVEAVALCTRPAHVGLDPVEMFPGTVDMAVFKTNFGHANRWQKELLEQTREERYRRRSGDSICVSYPPPVEQRHGEYETHGTYRRPGQVFYRPSRIISVR